VINNHTTPANASMTRRSAPEFTPRSTCKY